MASDVPTTVDFPRPLPARAERGGWVVDADGVQVVLSNLDKLFWGPEGYTKADLLAYYWNAADWVLPYVRGRPLTLKRMPDGADGEFFYSKRAPSFTPDWVASTPVRSTDTRKTIDYLLCQDRATLLWLANLGCIELHPWHARVDDLGHPDYVFFDLDPFGVDFAVVRDVALLLRDAMAHLGLRAYPRTSGATGMQVYVPIERVHSAATVREWAGRVCQAVHGADQERTTMQWQVERRGQAVFLDHKMNTEGKNIAATYSLRPERAAPVATPLRWEEVEAGVEPTDFTIATIWARLEQVGDLYAPVLAGGQDLRASMPALGMDPEAEAEPSRHVVEQPAGVREKLSRYTAKRDFARTPEPPDEPAAPAERAGAGPASAAPAADRTGDGAEPTGHGRRFVIQHHLATRLHHDLRLERGGVAVSWAVPKGLPDVPGLRRLAVQTEDHPLEYLTFSGDIPEGEYGGGPVRIWDSGRYEPLEWRDGKVTFRLHGRRHRGEYHLFRTGDGDGDWLVVRADEPAPGELPGDPPAFAPMLAGDGGEPFDDPAWLFEVKWDGVRALATLLRPGRRDDGATTLRSRQGNDITAAYPELARAWERLVARNAVVDGEIVALDEQGRPSFQRLQQRMHVRDPVGIERARKRAPVTYMAFDLLAVDGQALVDEPLSERLARLDEVLVPGGTILRSEAFRGEGRAVYEAVTAQGLEGVIAKRAASRYQPGRRSRDWLKIKLRCRVDVVIGGWLPGEGGLAGELGALIVGLHADGALRYVGRVGTGFDGAERIRLRERLEALASDRPAFADPPRERAARWVSPQLVCHVEYAEATGDGRLRAPSYKGLVDRDPRECVLEDLGVPC